MKNFILAVCAASAVALASPAVAAPIVVVTQPVSGTPLTAQIYGITNATPDTTQYGTEPANGGAANVTFTGNSAFTIVNGFAQTISGSASLTSLTINPFSLFTDIKLALNLAGLTGGQDGTVNIFYLLADGTTNVTPLTAVGSGNNSNFEVSVSGGLFDSITIQSTNGFSQVKQISIEPLVRAVPEPATWAMMLLGFGGIGMTMRRRQRRGSVLMQVA